MKKYILLFLIGGLTSLINGELSSQDIVNNNSKLFSERGYVRGITPARALGLVELGLGILSVIIATRSLKRSAKRSSKIALALGLCAVVFSMIHIFITAGAVFGSGSGKAGAIIAFILGFIGAIIAFLTHRSIKITT